MIDPELVQIATTRVRIELRDRHDTLKREAARMNAEMAANGLLRSGAHVRRVAELIEREYEIRAILIWQVISRVITGLPSPIGEADVQQIKEIVENQLDVNSRDIESMYDAVSRSTLRPGAMPEREGYRTRALEKVRSEIDISLLIARGLTTASSGSTTVNIYQPYGIVQTGAGSNAKLILADSREAIELMRALDAIEREITATSELDPKSKSQILEVVVDVRNEISKSTPNIHKLRGILMAIATTVQTMGSASGAYQLFKGAAALFGVNLP